MEFQKERIVPGPEQKWREHLFTEIQPHDLNKGEPQVTQPLSRPGIQQLADDLIAAVHSRDRDLVLRLTDMLPSDRFQRRQIQARLNLELRSEGMLFDLEGEQPKIRELSDTERELASDIAKNLAMPHGSLREEDQESARSALIRLVGRLPDPTSDGMGRLLIQDAINKSFSPRPGQIRPNVVLGSEIDTQSGQVFDVLEYSVPGYEVRTIRRARVNLGRP